MRIAVGCDHRALNIKELVKQVITAAGHEHEDIGCYTEESVDYPDIAARVAGEVVSGRCRFGILMCGNGIGMGIAANKVRGIRAAVCHKTEDARRARGHNDANIICLGEENGLKQVPEMFNIFLTTPFEGGRHQRRVDKIAEMES